MAQLVERRLGKAEVGGSNPLGSSMETLEFSRVFCCFKGEKNRPPRTVFVVWLLFGYYGLFCVKKRVFHNICSFLILCFKEIGVDV